MQQDDHLLVLPAVMQEIFCRILQQNGLSAAAAQTCARIFTESTVDGVFTHGVNRFASFVDYLQKGYISKNAVPVLKNKCNGIEQWDGCLAPGILNALFATEQSMLLAKEFGIGCVTLRNTHHWMRGGTYGRHAAKQGMVFIGWTNTIANMPAWRAEDVRLGNNPLVMAIPYQDDAVVLDMAMSQYSFGALQLAAMKAETLTVAGGFDAAGNLTQDPAAIIASKRMLPVGYWKGAGLSLLLDILAAVLSGGLSVHDISKQEAELGLSQVFICIDITKTGSTSSVATLVENIISDYKQSVPAYANSPVIYPGERVLQKRKQHLQNGIPVLKQVWDVILKLDTTR